MYRAKVIFAATLTAGIAYGSFIYTEVPKPFTKKDYVTAVTYEGELNAKQAEMLRLMDEDAKAQMKERNDPAADYVIVPTKDGKPITPGLDKLAGKATAEGPSGEITFLRGKGWLDSQWDDVFIHIWRAYPAIKLLYGNPFFDITVHVDYDPYAENPCYKCGEHTIVLTSWEPRFMKATILTHEMVHAFWDDDLLFAYWDQFQEGFPEALSIQVQDMLYADEPIAEDLWHHAGGSMYEYQSNINKPGIGTRSYDFVSPHSDLTPPLTDYRYCAAGFCWWKAFLVDRNFFKDFNVELYELLSPWPHYLDMSELQGIALEVFYGGDVEGVPFSRWLYEQPVINIPPGNATVMYLTTTDVAGPAYYYNVQLWVYERRVENVGGYDVECEIPLENVHILYDIAITGTPYMISDEGWTSAGGYLGIDIPSLYDEDEHRLRFRASAPYLGLDRGVFRHIYPRSCAHADSEVYGATTDRATGEVRLYDFETGNTTSAPVVNNAFHIPAFPDNPNGREAGDGKFALTLLDDEGAPVRTICFNKDAADYFMVIDDQGFPEGGAAAPATTPAPALRFAVAQTAPNPCSASASLKITLPAAAPVEVVVYDLSGRRVATPFAGALPAGDHRLVVDTSALPAGVYLYRVTAGADVAVKKMVVAR